MGFLGPQVEGLSLDLLANFLEGLALADSLPKRALLQFGMKYSGVHLGPATYPQEEADPRVGLQNEPNFYYAQHDYLKEFCSRHGIEWVDTRPGWILGAVPDAAMNITLSLAMYASVCRELGEPLVFPGDIAAWECPATNSSAMLNAYMAEWAVLSPAAANQSFNMTDDSSFTWGGCGRNSPVGTIFLMCRPPRTSLSIVNSISNTIRRAGSVQREDCALHFCSPNGHGDQTFGMPGRSLPRAMDFHRLNSSIATVSSVCSITFSPPCRNC